MGLVTSQPLKSPLSRWENPLRALLSKGRCQTSLAVSPSYSVVIYHVKCDVYSSSFNKGFPLTGWKERGPLVFTHPLDLPLYSIGTHISRREMFPYLNHSDIYQCK